MRQVISNLLVFLYFGTVSLSEGFDDFSDKLLDRQDCVFKLKIFMKENLMAKHVEI